MPSIESFPPDVRVRLIEAMRRDDLAKAKKATHTVVPLPIPGRRVRQSRDALNKLETRALEYLRRLHPGVMFRCQSKRWRVGGHWYKPDIVGIGGSLARETAWEVKGPRAYQAGIASLKDAAADWPEVDWILLWKDPNGNWRVQAMAKLVGADM